MFLPRAIELTQALLTNHSEKIRSLSLVPGHEGVFDITVNNKKIFAMEGVLPKSDYILKRVSEVLVGGAGA
jgi:predicted Rdx family selenoprotein